MPTARLVLILLGLLTCTAGLRAGPDEERPTDDVPVVGRPIDLPFSEASGWFEAAASSEPTAVEAETPLTFTLTVRAVRPTRRPPQRLDLRQLPAFDEQFYIEDTGEEPNRPDDHTWEFVYRLKPRHTDVTEIPSLPFVYFNPYLLTANKGFQVIYTDPIPLRVLPHEMVHVPVQAPESAFALAAGPDLLERRTAWSPGAGTAAALLLAPPVLCAVWYACWRRLYPDAARLASQRRSRAARQALQALHAARRLGAAERADRSAAVVAGYFRQRLDLTVAEPTPREIAEFFGRREISPALTEQAVRFFDACDSARFLPPDGAGPPNLPETAAQLILALEAETCPAPLS
jgi:hypothetical protein